MYTATNGNNTGNLVNRVNGSKAEQEPVLTGVEAEIAQWRAYAETVGFDASPIITALRDPTLTVHAQGTHLYIGTFSPEHFTVNGDLKRYAMNQATAKIELPSKPN